MNTSENRNTAPVRPTRPQTNDNLAQAVASLSFERQHDLWPHVFGPILPQPKCPSPENGGVGWRNPFRSEAPVRVRPATLLYEAGRIYDAISFAMRHHGIVLNAHLTITWGLLDVHDHAHAARLLTRFNHEAGKWLAVGSLQDNRQRMTQRAWNGGSPHFYVYAHENGREQGFHSHELALIPPEKKDSFEQWGFSCLARLSGRTRVHPDAFCLRVYKPRNEADAVARLWDWFRYITKSLSPCVLVEARNGEWVQARAIFKSRPFIEAEQVSCSQLASGSRNIWTEARRRAGFRSRYRTGEWDQLYDGSELEAWRQERLEEAEQRRVEQMLATLNL